jgi:hypothetical protein
MSAAHYNTFALLESVWNYILYPVGLLVLMLGVFILVRESREAGEEDDDSEFQGPVRKDSEDSQVRTVLLLQKLCGRREKTSLEPNQPYNSSCLLFIPKWKRTLTPPSKREAIIGWCEYERIPSYNSMVEAASATSSRPRRGPTNHKYISYHQGRKQFVVAAQLVLKWQHCRGSFPDER